MSPCCSSIIRLAPFSVPAALLAFGVPLSNAAASTGGPDGFGYTFIDNLSPGGPSFAWVSGSSDTEVPENGSTAVNLPFSFTFY